MSKMQNLQDALKRSTGREAALRAPSKPRTIVTAPAVTEIPVAKRQAGREGKFNLSSWQPLAFKSSLRLVQARKGPNATIEELMAEALNDLFMKYDVPTVNPE